VPSGDREKIVGLEEHRVPRVEYLLPYAQAQAVSDILQPVDTEEHGDRVRAVPLLFHLDHIVIISTGTVQYGFP
jgi:hypothetical protein